ncbi:MAG: fibronectin type III domain-containing protein, partial [Clostridiales bacterium]
MDRKQITFYTIIVLLCIAVPYVMHQAGADPVPVILSPPANLVAKTVSDSEIDLSWSAPTNLGGISITGYKIERSTDGGATWDAIDVDTGSPNTAYSDAGLSPSTAYTYRVSAITVLITSQPSSTATATTFGAPANLTVISQDNTGAAIPGFFTRLYLSGNIVGTGYTPHTFSLDIGQTYTVEVDMGYGNYLFGHWQDIGSTSYTRTISISSDKSIVAVYNTTPQPPTGLSATAMTTSQIDIKWSAPANNGGSPITGYKISRSTDSGATWSVLVVNTGNNNTTYSDIGLSSNTAYAYRTFAINAIGLSKASNVASATTPSTAGPPSPPTSLSATTVSSSQIDIKWSAPANNGGSPITGYK